MAKMLYKKDLEVFGEQIAKIGGSVSRICGRAVYEMANIAADKIRENINAMHYISDAEGLKRYANGEKAELTYSEKKGLQEGFGISSMQNNGGYMNVKLGFDGYNTVKTNSYPNGQPNVMIARAIESGSSIRDKHPFVRPAVNAAKKECLKKAEEVVNEEISKIMK